jgi:hypothetical protein
MQIGLALISNHKKTYIRRQATDQSVAIGVITLIAMCIKPHAEMGLQLAFMVFQKAKGALIQQTALEKFLLKPLSPQRSEVAFVQLVGETA